MAITGEDCSQLWSSSAPLPFGPLLWLQLLPTEQPELLPPGITVHHAVKLGSQNPPKIHPRYPQMIMESGIGCYTSST